jgi:hypothetical protein
MATPRLGSDRRDGATFAYKMNVLFRSRSDSSSCSLIFCRQTTSAPPRVERSASSRQSVYSQLRHTPITHPLVRCQSFLPSCFDSICHTYLLEWDRVDWSQGVPLTSEGHFNHTRPSAPFGTSCRRKQRTESDGKIYNAAVISHSSLWTLQFMSLTSRVKSC